MNGIVHHEIYVKKGLLLIFLVPLLFIMVLQIYFQFIAPLLIFGSIILFAGALFYYLLRKRKIIIDSNGITNQLLFKKDQYITWESITESSIEWYSTIIYTSFQWEFRDHSNTKVSIMMYNHSGKDLQQIAETLMKQCPGIRFDKKIRDLANGKYPLYSILN